MEVKKGGNKDRDRGGAEAWDMRQRDDGVEGRPHIRTRRREGKNTIDAKGIRKSHRQSVDCASEREETGKGKEGKFGGYIVLWIRILIWLWSDNPKSANEPFPLTTKNEQASRKVWN